MKYGWTPEEILEMDAIQFFTFLEQCEKQVKRLKAQQSLSRIKPIR